MKRRTFIKELVVSDTFITFGPPLVEGKLSHERGAELHKAIDAYGYDIKLFDDSARRGWACTCGEYNGDATFCCGKCGGSR